ncbi:MAG TPA: hypothetical protein VGX03_33350 [Candidatus Binatia bacterium]|jgi:hypothetical protein|nr:hypothetical protein [Candidatus Binatia bacterium]
MPPNQRDIVKYVTRLYGRHGKDTVQRVLSGGDCHALFFRGWLRRDEDENLRRRRRISSRAAELYHLLLIVEVLQNYPVWLRLTMADFEKYMHADTAKSAIEELDRHGLIKIRERGGPGHRKTKMHRIVPIQEATSRKEPFPFSDK